jgi:SAM-dependent methyltransferase
MLTYGAYKILHILGMLLIFAAAGGVAVHAASGGDKAGNPARRAVAIAHGVGLVLMLVAGFGMLARIGDSVASGWVLGKVAIWLVMGAATVLPYKVSLLSRLDFATVADVGCANGFLLEAFVAAGKRIAGIELSPAVVEVLPESIRPHVRIGDFAEMTGSYELVCCVEVAEHLPPARSAALVDTLAGLAERSIYFTAAPPGQGGHGHINCRPHAEWLEMFAAHGWREREELTTALRDDLASLETAHWLRGNSFVLGRRP